MRNEFTAIYELDESGSEPRYFAICTEIIGARAEGKTMDEAREKLAEAIKAELEKRREQTMRELIFDLPPNVTQEIIAVQETVAMQWVPYIGE